MQTYYFVELACGEVHQLSDRTSACEFADERIIWDANGYGSGVKGVYEIEAGNMFDAVASLFPERQVIILH